MGYKYKTPEEAKEARRKQGREYMQRIRSDPEKHEQYLRRLNKDQAARKKRYHSDPEFRAILLERNKERRDKRTAEDRKRAAEYQRAWQYGISIEELRELRARGVCDACGSPPTGRWKQLTIDHCHKTGKIRGVLCHNCNVAEGLLKDWKRAAALAEWMRNAQEA